MKYAQSAIAFSTAYDQSPGASRNRLYGFYSAKRERLLTGRAHDVEMLPPAEPMPIGHNPVKSFVLARSYVPVTRDKVRRKLKRR